MLETLYPGDGPLLLADATGYVFRWGDGLQPDLGNKDDVRDTLCQAFVLILNVVRVQANVFMYTEIKSESLRKTLSLSKVIATACFVT